MNPFINSFIENLIDKDVNLNQSHLTLINLIDKDGNYNVDLELATGSIDTLKLNSSKESKLIYGNITVLLIGKTDQDLKFLEKSIKKTHRVFNNKILSKNNTSFYDEDYVWSAFFNSKKELINLYIPEEKESADKIFESIKTQIKLSSRFKKLDCNCF